MDLGSQDALCLLRLFVGDAFAVDQGDKGGVFTGKGTSHPGTSRYGILLDIFQLAVAEAEDISVMDGMSAEFGIAGGKGCLLYTSRQHGSAVQHFDVKASQGISALWTLHASEGVAAAAQRAEKPVCTPQNFIQHDTCLLYTSRCV